uniref:hypothetical protein n=1 Tax=Dichomitus squalens TaxID=114155 RepID=UPI003003571F|nr:hypothetical protein [Dichomitus squalens]
MNKYYFKYLDESFQYYFDNGSFWDSIKFLEGLRKSRVLHPDIVSNGINLTINKCVLLSKVNQVIYSYNGTGNLHSYVVFNNRPVYFNNFYEIATVKNTDSVFPEIHTLYRVNAENIPSLNHLYYFIINDEYIRGPDKKELLGHILGTRHYFYQINQNLLKNYGGGIHPSLIINWYNDILNRMSVTLGFVNYDSDYRVFTINGVTTEQYLVDSYQQCLCIVKGNFERESLALFSFIKKNEMLNNPG